MRSRGTAQSKRDDGCHIWCPLIFEAITSVTFWDVKHGDGRKLTTTMSPVLMGDSLIEVSISSSIGNAHTAPLDGLAISIFGPGWQSTRVTKRTRGRRVQLNSLVSASKAAEALLEWRAHILGAKVHQTAPIFKLLLDLKNLREALPDEREVDQFLRLWFTAIRMDNHEHVIRPHHAHMASWATSRDRSASDILCDLHLTPKLESQMGMFAIDPPDNNPCAPFNRLRPFNRSGVRRLLVQLRKRFGETTQERTLIGEARDIATTWSIPAELRVLPKRLPPSGIRPMVESAIKRLREESACDATCPVHSRLSTELTKFGKLSLKELITQKQNETESTVKRPVKLPAGLTNLRRSFPLILRPKERSTSAAHGTSYKHRLTPSRIIVRSRQLRLSSTPENTSKPVLSTGGFQRSLTVGGEWRTSSSNQCVDLTKDNSAELTDTSMSVVSSVLDDNEPLNLTMNRSERIPSPSEFGTARLQPTLWDALLRVADDEWEKENAADKQKATH